MKQPNWSKIVYRCVVAFVVILCLSLFLITMRDVWNKFGNKLSNTGIHFRDDYVTHKKLPAVTICAWPAFKERGFFYNQRLFQSKSFAKEDFFEKSTLNKIIMV